MTIIFDPERDAFAEGRALRAPTGWRALPSSLSMLRHGQRKDLRVLLLGDRLGTVEAPGQWLASKGAVVWVAPARASIFDRLIYAGDFTHVVIDIDAMGGIEAAYTPIRTLRNERPDLPVVLISRDFTSNDFGTERLALCDASLRAPVILSELMDALEEARTRNNPLWCDRLADLAALH